ncbi:hypothetical protein ACFX13_007753 [Malus domestica]
MIETIMLQMEKAINANLAKDGNELFQYCDSPWEPLIHVLPSPNALNNFLGFPVKEAFPIGGCFVLKVLNILQVVQKGLDFLEIGVLFVVNLWVFLLALRVCILCGRTGILKVLCAEFNLLW